MSDAEVQLPWIQISMGFSMGCGVTCRAMLRGYYIDVLHY
jgi:hypothetical protein